MSKISKYIVFFLIFYTSSSFAEDIHKAILKNDFDMVQQILEADPTQINVIDTQSYVLDNPKISEYRKIIQFSFSGKDEAYQLGTTYGFTPLMVAIVNQNIGMIEFLLHYGVDVNIGNKDSNLYPIHIASIVGNYSIMELLLKYKINIFAKTNEGFNALILASAIGNTDVIRLLIKQSGSNSKFINNTTANATTALMYTALLGNITAAELLINAGSKINIQDNKGNTAMMYAAFFGNTGMIAYLNSVGANIDRANKQGLTPLLFAAVSGKLRTLQFLINQGADKKRKLPYSLSIGNKKFPAGIGLNEIARINEDSEMIQYLSTLINL